MRQRGADSTQDAATVRRIERLLELQGEIREALRQRMAAQSSAVLARPARDDSGDTIFDIDVAAEEVVLPFCERWAREESFVLVAEGLEPATGVRLGRGDPRFWLILDPIDGTRGLMYDKRSAWSLAGIAPAGDGVPTLRSIEVAVMSELPTTRQGCADVLWAVRGAGTRRRRDLRDGTEAAATAVPSRARDLRHGFATVCNFFQGGKELTARVEEEILRRAMGGWRADKAEVYTDQYISSGGQLVELAVGRDRFVLDIRPLVHRALGHDSTLCSRSYDVCTALVATEAGCVVCAPDGGPLDAPLDTTTNVAFAGYCNAELAAALQPIVAAVLAEHGLS